MASVKAEPFSPDIIDRGFIYKDGKKIYIRSPEPKSNNFKKRLERLRKEIRKKIIYLSPRQKQCLKIYYLSNKLITQREIAERLKISRSTVKEHLKRAIRKLKK